MLICSPLSNVLVKNHKGVSDGSADTTETTRNFRYMYQNYHNCARKSVIWMKETQPATSTASPESTPTTRRQLLKGALGAGVTAAADPSLSGVAAAHFPIEIAITSSSENAENFIDCRNTKPSPSQSSSRSSSPTTETARRSTPLNGPFAIGSARVSYWKTARALDPSTMVRSGSRTTMLRTASRHSCSRSQSMRWGSTVARRQHGCTGSETNPGTTAMPASIPCGCIVDIQGVTA